MRPKKEAISEDVERNFEREKSLIEQSIDWAFQNPKKTIGIGTAITTFGFVAYALREG